MEWIKPLQNNICCEPFAGNKDIKNHLDDLNINFNDWSFFDIDPKHKDIIKQNTIKNFPKGFDLVITNPPYLAKNSATRRGLNISIKYDDLYKDSLEVMLNNCKKIAAIIPDSYLHSKLFTNKIEKYIILNINMFEDTSCPVALVLFNSEKINNEFDIYMGNDYLGTNKDLNYTFNKMDESLIIRFNVNNANYFVSTIDSSKNNIYISKDLKENIKYTDRAKCNFYCNKKINIEKCNSLISKYRNVTKSVWLTSFKGLLKDNSLGYRKRISFEILKQIINESLV